MSPDMLRPDGVAAITVPSTGSPNSSVNVPLIVPPRAPINVTFSVRVPAAIWSVVRRAASLPAAMVGCSTTARLKDPGRTFWN